MQLNDAPARSPSVIDPIRDASRRLVRELGFMGGPFAGTDLSPSAVHALIEIDARDGITANELAATLRLQKSSVSRMLRKLVETGQVTETAAEVDGRCKHLSLSTAGQQRVAAIHEFARNQVSGALDRLRPGEEKLVLEGLSLYAAALASQSRAAPPDVEIVAGYQTGLIARIAEMHILFYARMSGFGRRFESIVAGGLAAFCDRLDSPANAIWAAMQGGRAVGSVAIDGEDLGPTIAHLRWFIVDDGVRGGGVGRKLLAAALAFADARGCQETHLWTFAGLASARRLYEATGFVCVEQHPGDQWGREVLEQRFVRKRPSL